MSISARCECGAKTVVADVMAGRTVRCSKCGGSVMVPQASATTSTAKPSAKNKNDAVPAISISPGIIIAVITGAVLLIVVLSLYLGPWRVGTQWAAISAKANDQVTDVVQFAIKAYESQNGMFDASQSHMTPTVQGEAVFMSPMMAFSMPRSIFFSGKTSQGNYTGKYYPATGEIEADIETGGFTVGGLVDVKKASGSFHITGREKDGNVEAECEGKPLKLIMPKIKDRFGKDRE